MSDEYFIGVDARELERLEDQHEAWRPETEALWARAGFSSGQHLADLGTGPGSNAFDLAQIVGSRGRVAALDKAPVFLDALEGEAKRRGIANIYTMRADLTRSDWLGQQFDGAFCRFLLAFLIEDLDRALRCIHRSLKPGGVFAAMEYLTLASTTCSPPIRGFDSHTRAWVEYYRRNGGDTSVGTVLAQKLTDAGFKVTHVNCVGGIAAPGERWWTWWGRLMEDFGDKLVEGGFMSAGELRDLRVDWPRIARQQTAFIHTPVLVQVVARKL